MPVLLLLVADAVVTVAGAAAAGAAALATAAGISAATAGAIGAFVGNAVIASAVLAGVSAVSSLFTPSPRFNTSPITFKADTAAGLPYVIGRSGSGGNIVFVDTSNDGNNTYLHYLTVHSIGPVTGFDKFTANNVPVTFDATTGQANHLGYNWRGTYSTGVTYYVGDGVSFSGSIYICVKTALNYDPSNTDYWQPAGSYAGPAWLSTMWQVRSLGPQPASYLAAPAGTGTVPEWTSSNTLSGLAASRWVLKGDTKSYANGTPTPLWTIRGPAVYDPRLDSTYPGGSGSQRASDPTTWAFSENPFLHALSWCLGQTSNGKRIMGLGAPISRIDVAAFVTGANVCDANGWKVGGTAFSTDSKWDVLTAILQAGCGAPMRNGALISCMVNTPRVSIATLTGADFTGPVSVGGYVARKDRINRVIYQYRSEPHAWQMVPATPIVVSAYVTADGVQRTKGLTMNYVQDVNQGAQLARYAIEDARELGPITGQTRPCWMGLQPGDCVTINEPEYGLNGQTVLILDRKIDPSTACPNLTMRGETYAKHAFALGQTGAPPPPPSLTAIDLVSAAPTTAAWSATGATLTSAGVSIPAIVVTGAVENPNASHLVVRTRLSAGPGPWTPYDSPPAPVATRVEITGIGSGETRDIGLSYLVRGIQGAELVISGVTAGGASVPWSGVTSKPANVAALSGSEAINNALIPAAGSNRVQYSQFEAGTTGWSIVAYGSAYGGVLSTATSGAYVDLVYDGTMTAAGQYNGIDSATPFPVTGGENLAIQARISDNSNTNTKFCLVFLDSSGSEITVPTVLPQGVGSGVTSGPGTPTDYLFQGFYTVPTNAVAAKVRWLVFSIAAGAVHATLAQPMVAGAASGQSAYPAFASGPNAANGATVGAVWGTNVSGIPARLTTTPVSASGSGTVSVSSASQTFQFASATMTIPVGVPGHYTVSMGLAPGGSATHSGTGSPSQNVIVQAIEETTGHGSQNVLFSANDTWSYSSVDVAYDILTGQYQGVAPSTLTGTVQVSFYIAWRGSGTRSFGGYSGNIYVTWTPN